MLQDGRNTHKHTETHSVSVHNEARAEIGLWRKKCTLDLQTVPLASAACMCADLCLTHRLCMYVLCALVLVLVLTVLTEEL